MGRRIGTWCSWAEPWVVCSVSVNASLALNSEAVSRPLSFYPSHAQRVSLSPVSDRYGRKKVLITTMLGNILSAVIWLRSTSFVSNLACFQLTLQATFLLSRLVGGLSEGNVQLSTYVYLLIPHPHRSSTAQSFQTSLPPLRGRNRWHWSV